MKRNLGNREHITVLEIWYIREGKAKQGKARQDKGKTRARQGQDKGKGNVVDGEYYTNLNP